MIQELDLVALRTDRPTINLRRGDVGTVVHSYADGSLYEVEFINANGLTISVETLNASDVQAVDLGKVILHYNDPNAESLENVA